MTMYAVLFCVKYTITAVKAVNEILIIDKYLLARKPLEFSFVGHESISKVPQPALPIASEPEPPPILL